MTHSVLIELDSNHFLDCVLSRPFFLRDLMLSLFLSILSLKNDFCILDSACVCACACVCVRVCMKERERVRERVREWVNVSVNRRSFDPSIPSRWFSCQKIKQNYFAKKENWIAIEKKAEREREVKRKKTGFFSTLITNFIFVSVIWLNWKTDCSFFFEWFGHEKMIKLNNSVESSWSRVYTLCLYMQFLHCDAFFKSLPWLVNQPR